MPKSYRIPISEMDAFSAHAMAAAQASKDQMPVTAKHHAALALRIKNASCWATANCPSGHRPNFEIVVTFVPAVNPVFTDPSVPHYKKEQ